MKKLLAVFLLLGVVSQVVPSDNSDHSTEPGYGQTCNLPEPSPKNDDSTPEPQSNDSSDQK